MVVPVAPSLPSAPRLVSGCPLRAASEFVESSKSTGAQQ